jgi:DNA-binding SARP family transcriptional activator/WD40 repeat protein
VSVTIQLLGPTQVGAPGPLSPRDRAILSALCVTPGSVVPAASLADALWGPAPPKSASKVVQGSIMRLRRLLGPAAIQTTAGGYRVVLPDGALDTVEFERLVARGRTFLAAREPQRAITAFREALSLWRGDPYAELASWDPAVAHAARLLDVRRTVEEDLVAAQLDAGRADEAAADARPLVAREPFRERRWALLATALYRTGRQGEALEVLRRARRTLRDELGLDPGPDLVHLEARILRQDPALLDIPDRLGGTAATCPYRGLRPFDAEDADFFFGRSAVVAEAVRRLAEFPLLLVLGPSGSGKSSLVRAGILPALARQGHPARVLTPGSDPLAALSAAVAALRPREVLVVDQLEELFADGARARVTAGFLRRLAELVDADVPVVATLRADFLGSLAESAELSRQAERGLLLLTGLTEAELREAIEGPARLVGLVLEPGLVDVLVQDVAGAPGGLPLLSHALAETWELREGTVMTVDGYRATGGIRSAVARSAEGLYESLSAPDRQVLRSVLQRLVTPTPSGDPVAARVPTRVFTGSADAPRLLDLLVRSRLVTTSQETTTIAHESLVRAWPRLRTWLDEDVEGQRILAHLQVAADGWEGLGRPADELYRGARLAAAQEWRRRANPVLAPAEEAFLTASAEAADADLARAHRSALAQARRNRQLLGALVAVGLLLVASATAGAVAAGRGREARDAAARADAAAASARAARLGATAVAEPDTALGLLLARQAVALAEEPAAEGALLQSLVKVRGLLGLAHPTGAPPSPVTRDHAYTPDGERLLALDTTGAVHLIDARTGASIVGALAGSGQAAWTSHPTGLIEGGRRALVSQPAPDTGDRPGLALVAIDTTTGAAAGPAQRVPGAVAGSFLDQDRLRVSPDGRTLVSVLGREIRIWHRRDGRWQGPVRVPLRGLAADFPEQDILLGVTFSADGRRAAGQLITQAPPFYVGQRVAFVVDTEAHRLLGRVLRSAGDGSGLWQTSLSPDGSVLVTGGFAAGDVQLRDAASGAVLMTVPGDSPASALAWSPDGRRLAIGRMDGTQEVFALEPLARVARLPGSEPVLSLAFTDREGLVSQDDQGTIARYDLTALSPVSQSLASERIHQVATGGRTVAVGGDDGGVTLRLLGTLDQQARLWLGPYPEPDPTVAPAAHRRVSALAMVPDGSAVIAADRTGHLRMWTLPDRRLAWSRDDVPAAWLAVSPSGRTLATLEYTPADTLPDGGARTARLRVWDLATRDVLLEDTFQGEDLPVPAPKPRSVVFSPDGTKVAAAFYEDLITVHDLGQGRRTVTVPKAATSITFTPDGTRLVAATPGEQHLSILDATTGAEVASAYAPRLAGWSRLQYSHDGRWLVMSHDRSLTILDGLTLQVAVADLPLPNDGTNDAFALAAPDNGHMLVGTQTTLVELDMDAARWSTTACRLAARQLTEQEWRRFLPEQPYAPACG